MFAPPGVNSLSRRCEAPTRVPHCKLYYIFSLTIRLPSFCSLTEKQIMLWTIIIILLVLWALGFGFAGQAVGSLIHILLIIAVIVLVLQLVRGRRGV